MWPLDVKRMEKIFGPFNEPDPGPDIILLKDLNLELSSGGLDLQTNNNDTNDSKQDLLTLNDVMDCMFGSNNRARPLPEMLKIVRNWLQEKRQFDPDEQKSLQNSIDCIQKCIDIDTQSVMIDRLSSIARQLKLKSHFRSGCFVIEAQFFTVDIKLEPGSGRPFECTVQHYEASKNNCQALVDILRKKQFKEFTQHIERISSLYKIGTDKSSKLKIFAAFDSLERDILMLETISKASINDCNNLVHISPVGVVEPRQGGSPMKLIYFVRPDELFDKKGKGTLPFTIETVIKRQLGHHVRVEIEQSEIGIKLQQRPLCDLKDKIEAKKSLPEFAFHNSSNSTILYACFVLKLSTPIVLSQELSSQISSLTNQTLSEDYQDLLEIFISKSSQFKHLRGVNRGSNLIIETKDFLQKYCINDYCENALMGVVIDSIKFNHPAQVSKILSLLRQQLLFNAFVESILKPSSSLLPSASLPISSLSSSNPTSLALNFKSIPTECLNKPTKTIEMTFEDLRAIHVKFTHPINNQEITLIINLNGQWSHSGVRCKVLPESLHDIVSEEKVLKVLQKTSSIPDSISFIINRIVESERKSKESDFQPLAIVKSTNTMLMNMLQDTGHAGKKRNLDLYAVENGNDSLSKEKKRRRTESSDSKTSNSSQEISNSISLLLSTPQNGQTSVTTCATISSLSSSLSSSSPSLLTVLSSSLSSSLSTTSNSGSGSTITSGNIDILQKQNIKPKSISLLQPQDSAHLKQKIQASKNAFLKSTSRQNSQEASSPNSSGSVMPENLAEILSRVTTLQSQKTSLIAKEANANVAKKLQDNNPIRRNTLTSVIERAKQVNNSVGSIITPCEKGADDRNAFTIKQSNSSSLKMSFTKNKSLTGSSSTLTSTSGNGGSGTVITTSGNTSGNSSSGNVTTGESSPAAELLAKIQGTANTLSLFGNKTSKYTIPKITKIQQQPQSVSIANALTDYVEKKPSIQLTQRSIPQTITRNLSPMRQNSHSSPQMMRSPQTSGQSLFAKQGFVQRIQHKPFNKLNSIVNALHLRQNSAPLGEETGLFKPLSQQTQQHSLIGSSTTSETSQLSFGKPPASQAETEIKPLSTPSSPVESPSAMLLEQSMQNVPVIIPVDAIEPRTESGLCLNSQVGNNNGTSVSGSIDKN